MRSHAWNRVCGSIAVVPVLLGMAWAQTGQTGNIAGQVKDQSGAVVSGATVTLLDDSTGAQKTTTTNGQGRYNFQDLNPGNFDVTVTKSGFQATRVAAQAVVLGNQTTVDVALHVGAATQTVEVTSVPGTDLQTTNATVGTAIAGTELQQMPNIGPYRDATTLVQYEANVNSSGMIAGASPDENDFKLDGGDDTDDASGDPGEYSVSFSNGSVPSGVVPTPVESVEEVRTSTSGQTADYGAAGGGEIQLATKRGTNSWHGSAYDYYQSETLNADSWANDSIGEPKAKFYENLPGASIGGPISPLGNFLGGKSFFYVNWEARLFPQAATETYDVPTASLRQGLITLDNSAGDPITYSLLSQDCGSTGNLACDPRQGTMGAAGVPVTQSVCGSGTATCNGANPDMLYVWNKLVPAGNDLTATGVDDLNEEGYVTNLTYPTHANFLVERFDHDFGSNWHLEISHRWYDLVNPTTDQTDIGGILPGDTLGTPALTSQRPAQPDYLVVGLTGTLSPTVTNQFHFNYVRNWWQWTDDPTAPLSGLPLGNLPNNANFQTSTETTEAQEVESPGMEPINVDSQNTRERFWNGHDWNYTDDLSWLRGNHQIQLGGAFRHWWDHFQRDDNGGNFNTSATYNFEYDAGTNFTASYMPPACPSTGTTPTEACIPSGSVSDWENLYADLAGIVGTSGVMYTRSGSQMNLQTLGTPLNAVDDIDLWNGYITDSWHVRPSLTLTLGLNYGVSLPPYDTLGTQVELVDTAGNPIYISQYLATRENDALQGIPYSPVAGFEQIGDVGGGEKYPFNIDYGEIGPHFAVAWNPIVNGGFLEKLLGHNSSVLRAGYSRIYDRENGVDLVFTPLNGFGFAQVSTCSGLEAPIDGASLTCTGLNGLVNPSTAFRVGIDGNSVPYNVGITATLPQPAYPGLGTPTTPASVAGELNEPAGGDLQGDDPGLKAGYQNEVNVSVQRQLPGNQLLTFAYVYDHGNDLMYRVDPDNVPYMMTEGGQTFAQAYGYLAEAEFNKESYTALTAQPFWEAALGGAGSSFCDTKVGSSQPTNCTQAVYLEESSYLSKLAVVSLWTALDEPEKVSGGNIPFIFGPDMQEIYQYGSLSQVSALGYMYYNSGSVSYEKRASHGLTLEANLTWSKELSTVGTSLQANVENDYFDPWNLNNDLQLVNVPPLYANVLGNWNLPWGNNTKGWLYELAGGWSFAPVFTWNNGSYLDVTDAPSGSSTFGGCNDYCENATGAVPLEPISQILAQGGGGTDVIISSGATTQYASSGYGTSNSKGVSYFTNPGAAAAEFRPCFLGIDTDCYLSSEFHGGASQWNMDLSAVKNIKLFENFGATFTIQGNNVFNHATYGNPSLSLSSASSFGVVSGATSGRTLELGLRVHW